MSSQSTVVYYVMSSMSLLLKGRDIWFSFKSTDHQKNKDCQKYLTFHGLKWLYRTCGHCTPRGHFQEAFCWYAADYISEKEKAHAAVSFSLLALLSFLEKINKTSMRKEILFINCHFIFFFLLQVIPKDRLLRFSVGEKDLANPEKGILFLFSRISVK